MLFRSLAQAPTLFDLLCHPCRAHFDEVQTLLRGFEIPFSVDEIGRRLGIPAGTVQSRLHYALKRLHVAIEAADATGVVR